VSLLGKKLSQYASLLGKKHGVLFHVPPVQEFHNDVGGLWSFMFKEASSLTPIIEVECDKNVIMKGQLPKFSSISVLRRLSSMKTYTQCTETVHRDAFDCNAIDFDEICGIVRIWEALHPKHDNYISRAEGGAEGMEGGFGVRQFIIKKVVDERLKNGKRECMVRLIGWEKGENLECPKLIDEVISDDENTSTNTFLFSIDEGQAMQQSQPITRYQVSQQ